MFLKKKTVLFAPNKTANPNAIPHKKIFDAVHGNPISGGTFNKDPEFINVKNKIKKSENNGRNELMEYMTNLNNQNYAIKQKALKRARGTDYSVSGLKRGGRITLKSGGRVGVGKAKRGFGRALRKK